MTITNPTLARYPDAEFENKSTNISVQLANKTIFPTPFPELEALTAAVKAFSEALALAIDGGRIAVSKKNAARKALEKMLKKAAGYVAMVAGDDTTIAITAGFETKKPKGPRPSVTAPENIQVESGNNPGEVIVSVDAVADVKTYTFEYTTDPLSDNSTWITEMDTRCSHAFTGLKPGQKYWFRVAAVGLRGAKVYSNVVACFVQ